MASTIGIKIANGEFYSIVEEKIAGKKRLVLTTVHNNQQSVQIDLYRSVTRTMADAQYIGSLVVENIRKNSKGDPSIEMMISSTANGDITADAIDLDAGKGGEHQILSVSLKSLDEEHREDELPDFELEEDSGEPPSGLYGQAEVIREEKPAKKFPWIVLIILLLIIILLLGAVWFFFFRGSGNSAGKGKPSTEQSASESLQPNQPVVASTDRNGMEGGSPVEPPVRTAQPAPPPPERPAPPPERPAPPPAQPAPPPVIQAPTSPPPARPQAAARQRPVAPVLSYKVPATIPREGVAYRIRWGDTLWDIAAAFYRNPWLYTRIARFNNIRNPDLIVSGTTIRIPPRN